MMNSKNIVVIVASLFVVLSVVSAAERKPEAEELVRYDNYKVVRVETNEMQGEKLYKFIQEHEDLFDLWTSTRNVFEVMVPPKHLQYFQFILDSHGAQHSIIIENVQDMIDNERRIMEEIGADPNAGFFDTYQSFDKINDFLTTLNTQYPKFTQVFQIGTTYQGRPINAIKISNFTNVPPPNSTLVKPGIVYNGCQHAREWISPMTVCYIASTLLYNYTNGDSTAAQLVNNIEWTLIPVVNGDGYVYTQTDRMWRKNRHQYSGKQCVGVDNNRNWNYEWGTGGASPEVCSDEYQGPSGFSEPEETAVANYITKAGNIQGYIDFHSYSQLLMNPWGYTGKLPADDAIQKQLMSGFVAAVKKVHGMTYGYGNVYTTIYPASGGSNDYTYGGADVLYSLAMELRPQSAVQGGFQLPPKEIIPQGQEIMAGVIYMGQFILANPQPSVQKPRSP